MPTIDTKTGGPGKPVVPPPLDNYFLVGFDLQLAAYDPARASLAGNVGFEVEDIGKVVPACKAAALPEADRFEGTFFDGERDVRRRVERVDHPHRTLAGGRGPRRLAVAAGDGHGEQQQHYAASHERAS